METKDLRKKKCKKIWNIAALLQAAVRCLSRPWVFRGKKIKLNKIRKNTVYAPVI